MTTRLPKVYPAGASRYIPCPCGRHSYTILLEPGVVTERCRFMRREVTLTLSEGHYGGIVGEWEGEG